MNFSMTWNSSYENISTILEDENISTTFQADLSTTIWDGTDFTSNMIRTALISAATERQALDESTICLKETALFVVIGLLVLSFILMMGVCIALLMFRLRSGEKLSDIF
uniref:Transmembrane protein n=1 Tax=Haemonchus contortus TaxID=6289 RepID=A0A7I4Y768_HAECO